MLFIKPGVRITGMRPEILLAALAAEQGKAAQGTVCAIIFLRRTLSACSAGLFPEEFNHAASRDIRSLWVTVGC